MASRIRKEFPQPPFLLPPYEKQRPLVEYAVTDVLGPVHANERAVSRVERARRQRVIGSKATDILEDFWKEFGRDVSTSCIA